MQIVRLTYCDRYNTAERLDRSVADEGEINPGYTGSQADIADSTGVSMPEDEGKCQNICYVHAERWPHPHTHTRTHIYRWSVI